MNTWDSQNRLVQCVFGGASTTDYVLDGTMAVQDVVNGAVAATYLTGPRGPEYRRDDETGAVRWYVYDGLGSVVGEVSPDGSLTCTRKLDVYGCVRSSSGTATSKHKFVGSLGHPSDDETGLIYMRARHYDPVTGRFISEDPYPEGKNWYLYAHNSPTHLRDRNGHYVGTLAGSTVALEIEADVDLVALQAFGIAGALLGTVALARYARELAVDGVFLSQKSDIQLINGICTELGLNRDQRRLLHNWISHQHLDPDGIRQEAEMIKNLGSEATEEEEEGEEGEDG